jgi:hypothetical protein
MDANGRCLECGCEEFSECPTATRDELLARVSAAIEGLERLKLAATERLIEPEE